MPKKYDHVHKYELIKLGRDNYQVYRCALPSCTHYIVKALGIGKESLCWRCGLTFVISAKLRNTRRPSCDKCRAKHGKRKLEERASGLSRADSKKPQETATLELTDLESLLSDKIDEEAADELLEALEEN